jgi:predicted DNA binding protein
MTVVAELTIPTREFVLGETLEARQEATVEFERIVTHSQEWVMPFLWVRTADFAAFETALRTDPTVATAKRAEDFDGVRLYQLEWADGILRQINQIFDKHGALVEATGSGDEWLIMVRFDEKHSLSELQKQFEQSGTAFTLQRIQTRSEPRQPEFGLTPAQRTALVWAVDQGYYSIPRQVEIAELADHLDISPTSTSERLRRAITTLTENALMVGQEPVPVETDT